MFSLLSPLFTYLNLPCVLPSVLPMFFRLSSLQLVFPYVLNCFLQPLFPYMSFPISPQGSSPFSSLFSSRFFPYVFPFFSLRSILSPMTFRQDWGMSIQQHSSYFAVNRKGTKARWQLIWWKPRWVARAKLMKNVPALHPQCTFSGAFLFILEKLCENTCKLKTGSSKIFIMSTLFDIVCMFWFCSFQFQYSVFVNLYLYVFLLAFSMTVFVSLWYVYIISLSWFFVYAKIYIYTHIIVAVFAFEVFVFFLCFFSMQ